jgi:hypothetical protein
VCRDRRAKLSIECEHTRAKLPVEGDREVRVKRTALCICFTVNLRKVLLTVVARGHTIFEITTGQKCLFKESVADPSKKEITWDRAT